MVGFDPTPQPREGEALTHTHVVGLPKPRGIRRGYINLWRRRIVDTSPRAALGRCLVGTVGKVYVNLTYGPCRALDSWSSPLGGKVRAVLKPGALKGTGTVSLGHVAPRARYIWLSDSFAQGFRRFHATTVGATSLNRQRRQPANFPFCSKQTKQKRGVYKRRLCCPARHRW